MYNKRIITIISALSLTVLMSAPGLSLAAEARLSDVNGYMCKDVMRMTGADREISVGFLHGWWMAKLNLTKFNKEQVAVVTDRFVEYCLDNPKAKAVDAMGIFVKN